MIFIWKMKRCKTDCGLDQTCNLHCGLYSQHHWLTDLILNCLTDWLTGLMTDWLADWLADQLTYWLNDWLLNWLMTDWLTDWLVNWVASWLTRWLTDWLTDWGGLVSFFSLTACRWSSEIVSRPILSQNKETRKPYSGTWWRTQNFLSYFVQNNRKSKFSIFDQNHGLTP